MSLSTHKTISLDAFVDDLSTRSQPNYIDITDIVNLGPLANLIRQLASPLLLASKRMMALKNSSRCLIFFDCGEFDALVSDVNDERLVPQRALIYMVEKGEFLQLSGEAYVRNINSRFDLPDGLNVTYACFRDIHSLEGSWEFAAGFYLWE